VRLAGIGPLESEALELIWDSGGWCTPGEVHKVLSARRPIAYTTVMTVMANLWKKQLLERRRDGRAFAYLPTQSREERAAAFMADTLEAVANRPMVLANFLSRLGTAERTQLRRILSDR
jgi:predicted transcriptional regulator